MVKVCEEGGDMGQRLALLELLSERKKANTERFKGSSIIYMQRLLNEDHKKRRSEINDLKNKLITSKK